MINHVLQTRDEEYRQWFKAAGFHDIRTEYIRPQWYRGKEEYAVAISGVKRKPGTSPAGAVSDDIKMATAPAQGFAFRTRHHRIVLGVPLHSDCAVCVFQE